MGHIVVGVDGSAASRRALAWAEHEALLRGASLVIVSAWEVPATAMMATIDPQPIEFNLAAEAEAKAVGALEGANTGATVAVRKVASEGHPGPVLMRESIGAELLVLGASNHGELTGMLLGSVALHAVTHAPCPVVVVRGET